MLQRTEDEKQKTAAVKTQPTTNQRSTRKGHGNLISGWTSPDRLSFDQF